jgi:hypothetical protein
MCYIVCIMLRLLEYAPLETVVLVMGTPVVGACRICELLYRILVISVYVRCCCRRRNLHLLVLAHKEFPFLADPDFLSPKSSFLNRWQCATTLCRH